MKAAFHALVMLQPRLLCGRPIGWIKHAIQNADQEDAERDTHCRKDGHSGCESVTATSQHTLDTRGLAKQKVRTRSPARLHPPDVLSLARISRALSVDAGPVGRSDPRLHQPILHPTEQTDPMQHLHAAEKDGVGIRTTRSGRYASPNSKRCKNTASLKVRLSRGLTARQA